MADCDYFLKLEGIEGEASDSKHKKEIDLESWSWGESNHGTHGHGTGGGGSGKVSFGDMHFVMKVNTASPHLATHCATGQHIKSGLLTVRKAGTEQQEYLKITLSDILISSYQTGGSAHSGLPTDQISLNFAKFEMEYKAQKPDGTLGGGIKGGYDLKEQKKT
jgi:type VI secretion system secreted protein Hcp